MFFKIVLKKMKKKHLFVLRSFALSFYMLMSKVMQYRINRSEVVKAQ